MQKSGLRTSVEWAASLLTTQLYHACLVEGQIGHVQRITEALDQKRNPNASIYYTELEPLMVAVELLRHFHAESDDVSEKLLLADAISAIKWEVRKIAEEEYSRVEAKAYERVANALRRHGKRVPKSKAPAHMLSSSSHGMNRG